MSIRSSVAREYSDIAQMPVNGVTLDYVSRGDGPLVLCVHGAISDHRVWMPLSDDISRKRRFLAYDQRYFGPAEWPDGGEQFSLDTHVDDLVALIEAIDDGPVHLVTRSYGGEVGTYAALKRPDLFRSMVHYEPALSALVDALPGGPAAKRMLFGRFGPAAAAVQAGNLEDAGLRFLEAVFQLPHGGASELPEAEQEMFRQNGRTVPGYFALRRTALTCNDLARIKTPTMVVHGGMTDIFFEMIAEEMTRCQPNALRLSIEGTNHDGVYRKPDVFERMLDCFLDLVEQSGSP